MYWPPLFTDISIFEGTFRSTGDLKIGIHRGLGGRRTGKLEMPKVCLSIEKKIKCSNVYKRWGEENVMVKLIYNMK